MPHPSVIDDLKTWGPESSASTPTLEQANLYCRQLATSHYENFPVVTRILPKPLRQHFANVYAFCRWADDLGDETGSREQSLLLLNWWQSELDRCYLGEVSHPVYVALQQTIHQFDIPQKPFSDLISAFVQDQHVLEYQTFDQLLNYCERSANPVGRLVLYLTEQFSEENARLADSTCTGLQLANFWQDVRRDYENIGRIYLPKEDRDRFGYHDDLFRTKQATAEFQNLMAFEIQRTREFLIAGRELTKRVRGRVRITFDLFGQGGLLILDAIERINYDVWNQRPVVKKSQLVYKALCSILGF